MQRNLNELKSDIFIGLNIAVYRRVFTLGQGGSDFLLEKEKYRG